MTRGRSLSVAGGLLGFALGGFFDGILLHQILQWHHLLSLVDGVETLAGQVLADGLLHAAMVLVALAGLLALFRARGRLSEPDSGRRLVGAALIGFGAWHWTDTILSHWLLGLHRIRIDSPDPLAWDLLWFALFGVGPVLAGCALRRGRRGAQGGGGREAAGVLAVAVALAGAWAMRPPPGEQTSLALFAPGVEDGRAVNVIMQAGGAVLWRSGAVWAVRWKGPARPGRLIRGGALPIGGGVFGPGCLGWSRRS